LAGWFGFAADEGEHAENGSITVTSALFRADPDSRLACEVGGEFLEYRRCEDQSEADSAPKPENGDWRRRRLGVPVPLFELPAGNG